MAAGCPSQINLDFRLLIDRLKEWDRVMNPQQTDQSS